MNNEEMIGTYENILAVTAQMLLGLLRGEAI